MVNVSVRELLEAGVHFGHQTDRWNPKMKPYIFGVRNGVHILDLNQTVKMARTAIEFVTNVTASGKPVLFIGTKRQAAEIVATEAKGSNMNYVNNRWLGGTLTNFKTIRASIERLRTLEKMKNSENYAKLTKKETIELNREIEKLYKNMGGIVNMNGLPGAIFVVDCKKDKIAVLEAKKLGVPVVSIVDSNCNPDDIDYVIPGNDDAIRSITLITSKIAAACAEGVAIYERSAAAAEKEAAANDPKRSKSTDTKKSDSKSAITASEFGVDKEKASH